MIADTWVALGGIAQLVAALATVVLAAVTAGMAQRTHEVATKTQALSESTATVAERTQELAKSTADVATATATEAVATESLAVEARADRRLAWRPHVGISELVLTTPMGRLEARGRVRNVGSGPALNVVVTARDLSDVSRWCIQRVGDLTSGQEGKFTALQWTAGGAITSPFEGWPIGRPAIAVALYGDVLGARYRIMFDSDWRRYPPEVWTEGPRPLWADEPLVWGD